MKISESVSALNKLLHLKGDVEIGDIEKIVGRADGVVLDFLKYISAILCEKKEILANKLEENEIELNFWKKLVEASEEGANEKEVPNDD